MIVLVLTPAQRLHSQECKFSMLVTYGCAPETAFLKNTVTAHSKTILKLIILHLLPGRTAVWVCTSSEVLPSAVMPLQEVQKHNQATNHP